MIVATATGTAIGIVIGAVVMRGLIGRSSSDPTDGPEVVDALAVEPDDRADMYESLRDALEYLEIGVLVVDPTGDIRYRNAAAREFRGTHVGLLVDQHVTDIAASTLAGGPSSMMVELHGPPKTWLEISADAVADRGAVVTIRDVSERQRTDAVRSDFVTNVSHELKTPVGAIAVLAEALVDETDPVAIRRLSDRLTQQAHRAVRTIDDLLELAQIESTRPRDDIVELSSVVQRAVERGRVADGGRGVEVTALEIPEGLLLRADEHQLVSALGNLVENAVKYSNAGDVVRIGVTADDTGIEMTVADQGIGIPARDLDRVFERFYRVDKARSRETGGTGLGLAIVRHIAANHGGEVSVSSQEGDGSVFVLRLPASLLVDPASADPDASRDHRG